MSKLPTLRDLSTVTIREGAYVLLEMTQWGVCVAANAEGHRSFDTAKTLVPGGKWWQSYMLPLQAQVLQRYQLYRLGHDELCYRGVTDAK